MIVIGDGVGIRESTANGKAAQIWVRGMIEDGAGAGAWLSLGNCRTLFYGHSRLQFSATNLGNLLAEWGVFGGCQPTAFAASADQDPTKTEFRDQAGVDRNIVGYKPCSSQSANRTLCLCPSAVFV